MSAERDPVIDEIIALLADTNAIDPSKVSPRSRLLSDLGLDGEDAGDFIEAFTKRFEVDFAGFHWLRYFGNEGLDAFAPMIALLRQAVSKETRRRWRAAHEAEREITIAHLANVAKAKRWIEPSAEDARPRPAPSAQAIQLFLALILPAPFVALALSFVFVALYLPLPPGLLLVTIGMFAFVAFLFWKSWRNVTRKLDSSPL